MTTSDFFTWQLDSNSEHSKSPNEQALIHLSLSLFFLDFIDLLIYNVILVSGVQQSDSDIYIYTHTYIYSFSDSFPL